MDGAGGCEQPGPGHPQGKLLPCPLRMIRVIRSTRALRIRHVLLMVRAVRRAHTPFTVSRPPRFNAAKLRVSRSRFVYRETRQAYKPTRYPVLIRFPVSVGRSVGEAAGQAVAGEASDVRAPPGRSERGRTRVNVSNSV